MTETQPQDTETLSHRLILPRDANHHGTLYAGTLLALRSKPVTRPLSVPPA